MTNKILGIKQQAGFQTLELSCSEIVVTGLYHLLYLLIINMVWFGYSLNVLFVQFKVK